MNVAVLGARGQLGRDLCPLLPGRVVPLTRADIDLARPESIAPALEAIRPNVFVNCAAYNFVDKAEEEPEAAFAVNAWGVRTLASACRDAGCQLVHFSTDYTFGLDRSRTSPFAETDPPGPLSIYGLSKLAGEYLVRAASAANLVLRTCGLYGVWGSGGKGGNFVETMLKLAAAGKPLRVVDDQRCTPSSTADVAAVAAELIRNAASGLYHLTNAGSCTWYEFAAEIFRQTSAKVDLTPTTTAAFGARAARPTYSVLSSSRLAAAGVAGLRPWQAALESYLAERGNKATARL